MQRAGGVELFPEARDERMRRLPSSRGCTARLCFGPTPGGTHENETSSAGLRPEGVYVYAERSQGRGNRPFLVGEHGCPRQSRTLEGRPALSNHGSAQITPKGLSRGRLLYHMGLTLLKLLKGKCPPVYVRYLASYAPTRTLEK